MSLKILGKKAFVLFLLFLAMACVYIVKNDKARESYFNSFKSIIWRADIFRGLSGTHEDDIKIDLSEINMNSLTENNSKTTTEVTDKQANIIPPAQSKMVVGQENTLKSISVKIKSIGIKADKLEQGVNHLIVLNQIEQRIKQISEQIILLSNEINQLSAYGHE